MIWHDLRLDLVVSALPTRLSVLLMRATARLAIRSAARLAAGTTLTFALVALPTGFDVLLVGSTAGFATRATHAARVATRFALLFALVALATRFSVLLLGSAAAPTAGAAALVASTTLLRLSRIPATMA